MFCVRNLTPLLLCLALVAGPAQAEPTPARLLARQFDDMESMRGDFDQAIRDENGELLQEASGDIVVKRPRRFYWRTREPYHHLVVTDGETLWLHDIDLEQVTREPFSNDLDRAPALILSGETDTLARQYAIDVAENRVETDTGEQRQRVFTLVSQSDAGVFRQLMLRFVDGVITELVMRDNFQQETAITFSNVEYNPELPEDQFAFEPPAGIDVIVNER